MSENQSLTARDALQPRDDSSEAALRSLTDAIDAISGALARLSERDGSAIDTLAPEHRTLQTHFDAAVVQLQRTIALTAVAKSVRPQRTSAPPHVKVAIAFMRANMHKPLSMAAIATVAGTSVRTLQAGFRQAENETPLGYLHRLRLEAVDIELSRPENTLSVSEVASKWGFTHMGRFAAHYRSVYGMYPSERAKRAQQKRDV